jgi:hypothetical protein
MRVGVQLIPWLIIFASFLILAIAYNSLPGEILIFRGIFGDDPVHAPRSIFTVFRVALIEVVCALAIEIMRRGSPVMRLHEHHLFWTILLYTVGVKSLLQTFEMILPRNANLFFSLTGAAVAVGLVIAAVAGRKLFRDMNALLLLYFGLAVLPAFYFA